MHAPIILPLFGLAAHTAIMLYIIACLGVLSYLVSRRLESIPNNIGQNIAEFVVEGIGNFVEETMGHHGKKYFPLIATLGIYILISNLLGLIPGLLPPTSNLNTTAGLAVIVFVATHIIGVKEHGIKYLKHFMGPLGGLPLILRILMTPLMIFVETISHLVRPVSLSLRLFGNIMGHELIVGVLLLLMPIAYPLLALSTALGVLVVFIQAFIFSLLSMMYLGGALEEAH
ncbi:MAG: ATP synthase F0 subunit A [Deltaproteobacteria bacterium GWC2_42_51]|nr:MAG: ATP synthase F0 subunit A [Deltaproteobacteria bacterium GWA2_42_85]OGP28636.1 MAG: ATP synthase F0 subunit A [Deltaproteobacteria bacterium GWB2_42_7]OGP31774.1 MAG: ATP synthase F0 subunit A [Deltaproteobacteria bacterium GWC2_42_51]OGP38811.1 MAG: ATP synthase F0 subunit A [Deltaproteobacteria bacterium GWD2_42_10]OGP47005.1 MAG: ATP synthase F0 subunit A [Deltaproteobacteria bacterium GWF2_42_12]OGQ24147.1 MAG: ATP synthase F0 subunit A [Deltaproteobacteria bacterium RIFCSPHIGHO2_0